MYNESNKQCYLIQSLQWLCEIFVCTFALQKKCSVMSVFFFFFINLGWKHVILRTVKK